MTHEAKKAGIVIDLQTRKERAMTHEAKKAGIVIDGWKQQIFERHLKAAGYTWEVREGPTPGVRTLVVVTINVMGLGAIVKAAEAECRKTRGAQLMDEVRKS